VDDRHRHRCQLSDDLADDVRMWRNFVALAPYALDRAPAKTTLRLPMQRSRTAAEAEDRLFHQLPYYRRRADLWPVPPRDVPSKLQRREDL
jgi:hypothetical protein